MKKALTAIALALSILFPTLCAAAWMIHLKDGRSFTTPEYREEGDQIKFYRYGGLIGIPKGQVQQIEEIADLPEETAQKMEEKTPDSTELENEKTTRAEKTKGHPEKEEIEANADAERQAAFMKEKRRILAEKENVSLAFREAKENNDKTKKDVLWQKLFQLREQLVKLQDKAIAENNGVLPPWWDQIE